MRFLRPALFAAFILPAALVVPAHAVPQSETAPQQSQQGSPTSSQQSTAVSDDKLCTLAGTVLSANTGEPLRRAHVNLEVRDKTDENPYRAVTDSSGHFAIEHVAPGSYDLQVVRDGYQRASYGQMHPAQSGAVLVLAPGQKMTDLLFRLRRLAVVTGRVVDPDGDPLQQVNVSLVLAKAPHGTAYGRGEFGGQTDDLGNYRIFDVLPGRYILYATPNDARFITRPGHDRLQEFQRVFYPAATDAARATTLDVKSGDEITGMDITLLPSSGPNGTFKVRGRVIDNTGVKGDHYAMVALTPRGTAALGFNDHRIGMSDEKTGAFEIDNVASGDYEVAAVLQTREGRFQSNQKVTVVASDIDNITLVLSKGVDVAVRVTVEGKAASAVSSDLMAWLSTNEEDVSPFGGHAFRSTRQQDGSLVLSAVNDGVYEVKVGSGCQECYVKAADANGIDVLTRGFQVSDGAAPSRIDILYSSESGSVTGTVTNKDDLPAVGATVVLVPSSAVRQRRKEYEEAPTDQYGRFEVKGLPPGDYTAYAFEKADPDVYEDAEAMRAYAGKGETVSVAANGRQSVELKMIPEIDAGN